MNNKKAVVLGANGYLGSNLCFWLLQNGFSVLAVGRQAVFTAQTLASKLTYLQADLGLPDAWESIDLHADLIFMMAGATGTKAAFDQPAKYVAANELSLIHLLTAYQKQGSKGRIVFPSSRLVYKGAKDVFLKEDAPQEAKTVYAANKIACEHYLHAWGNAFGIPYTVFRICVPFGNLLPGNYSYGTLGFMMRQAAEQKKITLYGDGSPKRTFTHVADICRLMTHTALLPQSVGETYNIGGSNHSSLLGLAQMVAQKTGTEISFVEWPELDLKIESGDTLFDGSKLEALMGTGYRYSLESELGS